MATIKLKLNYIKFHMHLFYNFWTATIARELSTYLMQFALFNKFRYC